MELCGLVLCDAMTAEEEAVVCVQLGPGCAEPFQAGITAFLPFTSYLHSHLLPARTNVL